MTPCNFIKKKASAVCTGDLDKKIILQDRSISVPSGDNVDYGETFTESSTVWARVDTVSGETVFDGTNTERDVSHRFYIRYVSGITAETWVEVDSVKFDILAVENIHEDNNFLLLRSAKRGDKSSNINLT